MALRFEPYGNPLAGQALKQAQYNQLNDTLMGISRQGQQQSQFNREQAIRDAEEARRNSDWHRLHDPMPDNVMTVQEPSHRDYTGLFSDSQPQNPLSLNPSVVQPMGQQDMPTRPMMGPMVSPIVTMHLQDNPHFADISPYGPKPGQSRADYAEQQSWKTADLGNQKTMADISEAKSKGKLYESQAEYYGKKAPQDDYYFVDSSNHQMFDRNMNPIALAPPNAKPKVISNPYAGSEYGRRDALSIGAVNSVERVKELMTPEVLGELKGIKFTPGKMYSQIASPEGKEAYRNLYNAISNQLYLKTGATANPSEIENNMIMYMPAYNDEVPDIMSRLDMLSGEASLYAKPSKGSNGNPTQNVNTKNAVITKKASDGNTYVKRGGQWYRQ